MTTPFNISPENWSRVSSLFDELVDLPADACAVALAELRRESAVIADNVEALLRDAKAVNPATPLQSPASGARGGAFTELLNAALAEHAHSHSPGDRFGAWALTEKIGSGGMGEVWRAARRDGLFDGLAAIKLLRSDLAASKLAARFARERSVLARLNHPNIARLLDAGVGGSGADQAFLVLELVEGLPLLEYAQRHAPRVADRVQLVRDVASAVEYAHSQLVLHRDIKPSNVLVTAKGEVKLLDFGIAAAIDEIATADTATNLTQLTGRGLTLEYAAPEQIAGDATVAASDTYSLGAMLFHLLAGAHPFAKSANRLALQQAALSSDATRVSSAAREAKTSSNASEVYLPNDVQTIDADLDAIVAKSLRKSPTERYSSAALLIADLDAWLTQSPISIRADDRRYRGKLWLRRNWKLATLGSIAVASVLIGLSVSLWQRNAALASAALAKEEAARATKVADYLGELIQSASPDNHGGKWPTVLALLEQSERDLEAKFKDDPRTHARLLKQMLDTNDALQRDTVALAQAEKLLELLATIEPIDRDLEIEVLRQKGYLLNRLLRHDEARKAFDQLMSAVVAHLGTEHIEYSKALYWQGSVAQESGRFDEALALYEQSYTLLFRLRPNNLRDQLNFANDKTVLFTRQNRWRDAERALSSVESIFDRVAATDGASLRDVLIMRNNLEAIRIRVGKYDGANARLQSVREAGNTLLGRDNMISIRADGLRASLACSVGDFPSCLDIHRLLLQATKKRVGVAPIYIIESELDVLAIALLIGQVPKAETAKRLRELIDGIPGALNEASAERSFTYRLAADAAIRADDISLAREAVTKARSDLANDQALLTERAAHVDRAEAAIAFRSGDPRRAVELLSRRFTIDANNNETDTPRHAVLWLQRALYELEFDVAAATKSVTESRAAFARVGKTTPQWQALIAYVDARLSGGAAAIRRAQTTVDSAFFRARPAVWTIPHLSSL